MADFIKVTDLNRLAKQVLAQCDPLNDVIVCGEISGFVRHYKSGHIYFTLKDENAGVKAVMFRSQARLLPFEPQNGMQVLVYGHATIYERDGSFQLYADYMRPFGAGAAQMAFDALYKKLEAEGLFAPERKRPLPAVPRCIGVVTSKTGAAWQDVQNVIARRWPGVQLLLAPVNVQGLEAERSIVAGIRALDNDPRPELILVTRGGGSKEDLWIFNSERIARAAAACRKPLVSAVGHETDFTICDFVADRRAPTPSAAAELAVPDSGVIRAALAGACASMSKAAVARVAAGRAAVEALAGSRTLTDPQYITASRWLLADRAEERLCASAKLRLSSAKADLREYAAKLVSLNPLSVLSRGYGAVSDADGNVITSASKLTVNENITVRFSDGEAKATVTDTSLYGEK